MPPIDRRAIQNDLFSLCVSGDEQVRNYLDFSDAYFEILQQKFERNQGF